MQTNELTIPSPLAKRVGGSGTFACTYSLLLTQMAHQVSKDQPNQDFRGTAYFRPNTEMNAQGTAQHGDANAPPELWMDCTKVQQGVLLQFTSTQAVFEWHPEPEVMELHGADAMVELRTELRHVRVHSGLAGDWLAKKGDVPASECQPVEFRWARRWKVPESGEPFVIPANVFPYRVTGPAECPILVRGTGLLKRLDKDVGLIRSKGRAGADQLLHVRRDSLLGVGDDDQPVVPQKVEFVACKHPRHNRAEAQDVTGPGGAPIVLAPPARAPAPPPAHAGAPTDLMGPDSMEGLEIEESPLKKKKKKNIVLAS